MFATVVSSNVHYSLFSFWITAYMILIRCQRVHILYLLVSKRIGDFFQLAKQHAFCW
jgi:hypothetical protein